MNASAILVNFELNSTISFYHLFELNIDIGNGIGMSLNLKMSAMPSMNELVILCWSIDSSVPCPNDNPTLFRYQRQQNQLPTYIHIYS